MQPSSGSLTRIAYRPGEMRREEQDWLSSNYKTWSFQQCFNCSIVVDSMLPSANILLHWDVIFWWILATSSRCLSSFTSSKELSFRSFKMYDVWARINLNSFQKTSRKLLFVEHEKDFITLFSLQFFFQFIKIYCIFNVFSSISEMKVIENYQQTDVEVKSVKRAPSIKKYNLICVLLPRWMAAGCSPRGWNEQKFS